MRKRCRAHNPRTSSFSRTRSLILSSKVGINFSTQSSEGIRIHCIQPKTKRNERSRPAVGRRISCPITTKLVYLSSTRRYTPSSTNQFAKSSYNCPPISRPFIGSADPSSGYPPASRPPARPTAHRPASYPPPGQHTSVYRVYISCQSLASLYCYLSPHCLHYQSSHPHFEERTASQNQSYHSVNSEENVDIPEDIHDADY